MIEGCGVLFMIEKGSGIIICGQNRQDGNCFLCKRCLEENKNVIKSTKQEMKEQIDKGYVKSKSKDRRKF